MLHKEEGILQKEEGIECFAGRREFHKEEGIECFAGRRESFTRRRN